MNYSLPIETKMVSFKTFPNINYTLTSIHKMFMSVFKIDILDISDSSIIEDLDELHISCNFLIVSNLEQFLSLKLKDHLKYIYTIVVLDTKDIYITNFNFPVNMYSKYLKYIKNKFNLHLLFDGTTYIDKKQTKILIDYYKNYGFKSFTFYTNRIFLDRSDEYIYKDIFGIVMQLNVDVSDDNLEDVYNIEDEFLIKHKLDELVY